MLLLLILFEILNLFQVLNIYKFLFLCNFSKLLYLAIFNSNLFIIRIQLTN